MTITDEDFDILRKRVTKVEVDMGAQKTKVIRNEEDIQKIFESMAKLPFYIVGTMLVPSILILYQIITK